MRKHTQVHIRGNICTYQRTQRLLIRVREKGEGLVCANRAQFCWGWFRALSVPSADNIFVHRSCLKRTPDLFPCFGPAQDKIYCAKSQFFHAWPQVRHTLREVREKTCFGLAQDEISYVSTQNAEKKYHVQLQLRSTFYAKAEKMFSALTTSVVDRWVAGGLPLGHWRVTGGSLAGHWQVAGGWLVGCWLPSFLFFSALAGWMKKKNNNNFPRGHPHSTCTGKNEPVRPLALMIYRFEYTHT